MRLESFRCQDLTCLRRTIAGQHPKNRTDHVRSTRSAGIRLVRHPRELAAAAVLKGDDAWAARILGARGRQASIAALLKDIDRVLDNR